MTEIKTEFKAHLFAGKDDKVGQMWILCNDCANKYLVPNSPVHYMGEAYFVEVLSCDKCDTNLVFGDNHCYASKVDQDPASKKEREERDTDPAPSSHTAKAFSLNKMIDVLGFAKKT